MISKAETNSFTVHCSYNEQSIQVNHDPENFLNQEYRENEFIHWINLPHPKVSGFLPFLSKNFEVHSLVEEDILNLRQRSKVEDYRRLLFIVCRYYTEENGFQKSHQLSIIVRNNLLITIPETNCSWIQELLEKIKNPNTLIRKKGEDFLLYTILDWIVDKNFDVIESINAQTEKLEEGLLREQNKLTLLKIQHLKRQIIDLRRQLIQVKDMIASLNRSDIDFFEDNNKYYLRDLIDHSLRAVESIDNQREILNSLTELYHSLLSNKMNVVMKTLTVISTIFIPLTFIVGIYGMNFPNIPELHWKYGYPMVMGLMSVISAGMIFYFYRKKWF